MNKPNGIVYDWKLNIQSNKNLIFAGFWIRFFAFVIDTLIGFIVAFILFLFIDTDNLGDRTLGGIVFLFVLGIRTYFQFVNGQSIGQKFLKIKIVSEVEKSIGRAIVRNFTSFFLLAIPLGNAVNAFILGLSKEKQGIHDRVVNTWVVREIQ